MTEQRFIQVILPLRLKWEPVYSVPASPQPDAAGIDGTPSAPEIKTGVRVRVNFSRKEYVAVVSNPDASKAIGTLDGKTIKPILSLAEGLEPVTQQEIELWRQVAEYYLCEVGEVYKAAYPALKIAEEEVEVRTENARNERQAKAETALQAKIKRLEDRLAKKEGLVLKARTQETKSRYSEEKEKIGKELEEARKEASAMHQAEGRNPSDLCVRPDGTADGGKEITLSAAQEKAHSQIVNIFKEKKPALLHGVTGSGKTEIYIRLAEEALSKGRNVLYLVPEIALSRQLEDRLQEVFKDRLQVFHSKETIVQRRKVATFIRNGSYVVLGTRSSLFLPHKDLGLVIVDEENDNSYKQDSPAPRYNGRETAIMLARIFSADIVLGSATPSLESLYNCSAGRFGLVPLTERYFNAGDSDVEIIDTIAERKKNGMIGHFSRKLISMIKERLDKHEQVILLRERRALSPMVQCKDCGDIPKCKHCNVTLSLHKRSDGSQKLVCHYCGRVYEYTGKCLKCGGELKPFGAGTQKIEEEAQNLFPEARIARLDSDSAKDGKYEKEVIRKFSQGEIDILIGTRIVAKGFDFSGLSLVAVLQADSILGQQDFRADEKGLQLLEQFRGRCGRRDSKGLFAIQTSQPEHPVFQDIDDRMKADELQKRMLAERKAFGYPPYSRVVEIIVKDYSEKRADFMSGELSRALGTSGLQGNIRITGPYSPPVDKISNQNIRHIRILLPKDRFLNSSKTAISKAVESFEKKYKYSGHISLDVDPV